MSVFCLEISLSVPLNLFVGVVLGETWTFRPAISSYIDSVSVVPTYSKCVSFTYLP